MEAKEILAQLIQGNDLSYEQTVWMMNMIMEGGLAESQVAAMLIAMRIKQETVQEITACAVVMRQKATKIPTDEPLIIDTCGTGGDASGSFNISTTVALLLAGAGYKIAKHGNRSMTSQSGSADLLEALGVSLNLSPRQVADCIKQVNIGFLFAPALHSAMKNVVPVRKELGVRTIFNILGPLTNPAGAQVQTIGLFDPKLVSKVIRVLKELGARAAYVFSGLDGFDEVSITTDTQIAHLSHQGEVSEFMFDPEDYGFKKSPVNAIKGGTPAENAGITLGILAGDTKGPKRDIVQLNAGFAIAAADGCPLDEAFERAGQFIDSGRGMTALTELIAFTSSLSEKN